MTWADIAGLILVVAGVTAGVVWAVRDECRLRAQERDLERRQLQLLRRLDECLPRPARDLRIWRPKA